MESKFSTKEKKVAKILLDLNKPIKSKLEKVFKEPVEINDNLMNIIVTTIWVNKFE